MSEIPIGSPPVPPGRHAAPSGWYPDPLDLRRERYWDGWQWARTTRQSDPGRPIAPGEGSGEPNRWPGTQQPASPSAATAGPRAAYPLPQLTADGVPVAGWGWRALAVIIDDLLTSVVVWLFAFPVWRSMYRTLSVYVEQVLDAQRRGVAPPSLDPNAVLNNQQGLILIALSVTIGVAYHTAMVATRGATVGKLIVGLRVVPVDQGFHRGGLGWGRAFLRALIWVVPSATSWLLVIRAADALLPLWHPKRQALHDLGARTQVVRPVPASAAPGPLVPRR